MKKVRILSKDRLARWASYAPAIKMRKGFVYDVEDDCFDASFMEPVEPTAKSNVSPGLPRYSDLIPSPTPIPQPVASVTSVQEKPKKRSKKKKD